MKIEQLIDIIGSDFFTGVPDSQLKPLCNYLMDKYGINTCHHIIAANEGNSVALAGGIIWQPARFRWFICKTVVKEIS